LITPGDGYRVEAYDYANGHIVLNMYVKSEGERVWNYEIARWDKDTPGTRGLRAKMYWLWAAFCHYLNAGGLGPASELSKMQAMCSVNAGGRNTVGLPEAFPLVFPPGYFLVDTGPMHEIDVTKYEHVLFDKHSDKAIVWAEDMDIEETTKEQLARILYPSFDVEAELAYEEESTELQHPCDPQEDAAAS